MHWKIFLVWYNSRVEIVITQHPSFRKLFVDNFLLPIPSGNCAEDPDVFLIKSHDVPNNTIESQRKPTSTSMSAANDTDFKTIEIEKKLAATNALNYVSGYLRKCLNKHNCNLCSSQLFIMFRSLMVVT